MTATDEHFGEAASEWDLETLYTDLASAKGKRLTPVEKLHLRGLLCGHSPAEIAEKLSKNGKGVETDLCATVYKYVKGLVDKSNGKVENWRNISEWLEEAGYKSLSSAKVQGLELLPEKSIVNITNINIEKNQIVFLINLRIPTQLSSDLPTENLGEDIFKGLQ
ncbi:helix-turn-helix domain-containing protein [Anabaena subtropica]|uniref:Helix-turn-helix domain-containing protein n=1 Tax=Anabaena subtropica FACHB-260 TaxID=2692884 RepID=A0ABR8CPJ8_9NOST|nr:helix-turn-helix domain-containing protein [Anabaena subtropica]MBD2344854.1 helix-turn-helix domain-containing protein [Anabaena subtropica FACHB-260]